MEKLLAQVYLELKEIRSRVDLILGEQTTATGWAGPDEAATALKQDGVKDARHLQRLRLDGAFSELRGEIRNTSKGNRPTWQYHIPKCRTALQRYFKRLAS
ncbi:MAG: hypothetical protein ACKO7W_09075 [Elainella sp.]